MNMNLPEKKNVTERLDLQGKIEDTMAEKRPVDNNYPYIQPDYEIPFLHIGTEKQLFLDNFILDHLEDIERIFPEPHRAEEPMHEVDDLPWAYNANPIPVAAIHDSDDCKFKLWYAQSLTGDPFNTGQVLCYAESTDCLHWEKPLSKVCLSYKEHKSTNIVQRDTAGVTVVLNHDQSDPDRKFLMLYCAHGRAKEHNERRSAAGAVTNTLSKNTTTVAASPDGLQWTDISADTPYRHHHESRIIWDEAIQKWVAYSQYSHHWNFLHRKRQIGRQESEDFINWSPKEIVISSDGDPNLAPHLEFHEMSVRKVGDLYIGIPAEFIAEPVWQVHEGRNWRDQAHIRLGLYTSRDGRRWQRVGGPEAWVENRGPGSIDYGCVCYTAAGMLEYDGKITIPYLACPDKQHWYTRQPHPIVPETTFEQGKREWERLKQNLGQHPRRKRSVGGLVLREDGWAKLSPVHERGKVITRQFVFEGNTLKVNSDAYGGYLRVEVVDPYFQPYEGFSVEDCDPTYSNNPNEIWHTITWNGDADVQTLWNKPVRLIFHLHQASLYAFQFELARKTNP